MSENEINERRLMGGKKCRAKEDGSKENKVRGLSGQAEVWPQLEERMRLM